VNLINKHIIYLTVDTNKDPKKVRYSISILIKDTAGKQYLFKGVQEYEHNESGKAYTDLEVLQTINFSL